MNTAESPPDPTAPAAVIVVLGDVSPGNGLTPKAFSSSNFHVTAPLDRDDPCNAGKNEFAVGGLVANNAATIGTGSPAVTINGVVTTYGRTLGGLGGVYVNMVSLKDGVPVLLKNLIATASLYTATMLTQAEVPASPGTETVILPSPGAVGV
jgi:hypothetical protein